MFSSASDGGLEPWELMIDEDDVPVRGYVESDEDKALADADHRGDGDR